MSMLRILTGPWNDLIRTLVAVFHATIARRYRKTYLLRCSAASGIISSISSSGALLTKHHLIVFMRHGKNHLPFSNAFTSTDERLVRVKNSSAGPPDWT